MAWHDMFKSGALPAKLQPLSTSNFDPLDSPLHRGGSVETQLQYAYILFVESVVLDSRPDSGYFQSRSFPRILLKALDDGLTGLGEIARARFPDPCRSKCGKPSELTSLISFRFAQ